MLSLLGVRRYLAHHKNRASDCFRFHFSAQKDTDSHGMKETLHQAQGSKHTPVEKGLVRIYNMRFCPFAHRSVLVATAKGIKVDIVNINLSDKPDWFLALNPKGQVPTLEHDDGRVLSESLLVSDYLDEIGPKSRMLHPADPYQKAKDRLLVEQFSAVTNPFFKLIMTMNKPEADMAAFNEAVENLVTFEKELKSRGTKFFGGGQPMMVDYMIWPAFERMGLVTVLSEGKLNLPKDRFPLLSAWALAMKEDEAVKTWLLPAETHAVYMKSRFAGAADYDFLAR